MTELSIQQGMHITADPETGAIASAVSTPETEAAITENKPEENVSYDPRKAIMDKIYSNRADQYKQELEYAAEISNIDNFNQSDEQVIPEKPKEPIVKEIVKQPDPIVVKDEKPLTKRINFNGQSLELTEQELEQLAARALYAQQAPQQQQIQQQQPIEQRVEQSNQPQTDPSVLKDIARRITYGSEEESAKALGDFANLTANLARASQPEPNQLVQAAAQQAVAQVQFQNNLSTIASEYKDVFEDTDMTIIAARKVGELRNKYNALGTPRPDIDLYREACNLTRDKFGISRSETASNVDKQPIANQQAVTTANVSQTRIERKRSAPQPAAAVNKVQQMQQQSQYPSGSQIVNQMRKSRGQTAM